MRLAAWSLAIFAATAGPALGQAFPGADQFPLVHVLAPDATDVEIGATLAGILYKGATYTQPHTICEPVAPCAVVITAVTRWTRDQVEHVGLVFAAELPEAIAYHAAGALIGAVDLAQTAHGWEIKDGSPMIAQSGSFGKAPQTAVFDTGKLGMAVVLMPGAVGQGLVTQRWQLYLPKTHQFRRVLDLPMTADSTGMCGGDHACLQGDFTTHFNVFVAADGITVEAIKTADGVVTTQAYRCNLTEAVCR